MIFILDDIHRERTPVANLLQVFYEVPKGRENFLTNTRGLIDAEYMPLSDSQREISFKPGCIPPQLLRPIVYVEVNSSILTALRSKFPEPIKLFKRCISDKKVGNVMSFI